MLDFYACLIYLGSSRLSQVEKGSEESDALETEEAKPHFLLLATSRVSVPTMTFVVLLGVWPKLLKPWQQG